jgi:hypothetical protein
MGDGTMTIFELVKNALKHLYAEGVQVHKSNLDEVVKDNIKLLGESYRRLNHPSRTAVDYEDPATRFAYVYKYVAAHGDYVVQLLEILGSTREIFENKNLRVSCLGGGPGSDIIGILKYLEECGDGASVKNLTCHLLDREQAWSDTWSEIKASLRLGITLDVYSQTFDITDATSWKHQKKFLQADLFTLIYFVSEVIALDKNGEVAESFLEIFERAKSGALFLYIDNGHDAFTSYFDKLCKKAHLKCLVADDVRWIPRRSEHASEVDVYRTKFGHNPKLQAQLTYRVFRKP